ncbi:MAG: ATP-binding protein [Planctomycetota bacterium]|nr:ATP-binding protein [Planctomycetota bacterium]MCZ6812250.1 ATP-binding protein [Planctomycetota bacterium]MCZ6851125.1 ATP-binding protein [Planctomycetota bacterium]
MSFSASTVGWLAAMPPVLRLCLLFGVLGLVCAALLLPVGVALDRTVTKLRSYIEATGAAEGRTATFYGPKWVGPISGALIGAVEQFRQREQTLRNELREVEIRRRVSEAEQRQVEAVLHALRDGVLVTNAFNDIVVANEAAGRIFGFDHTQALHQPLEQFVDDDRLCQLIKDTSETANFADRRHVEHDINVDPGEASADGKETRIFDVTLACVENHKHEVAGVVTILHDVTREREISQMKSDFVSKASHELRTPLSSIHAYVEMLVDGEAADDEARNEFYRIIQNETDRLGRLLDNMLNISRIEAGIVQIERENVDLRSLIDRAIDTLEPQAKEKEISLHTKVAEVDLTVEGDADMLFQVVLNLISNSVKYTPAGGRITVSADSDNLTRSVVLAVSDTGLGIPPDSIPKLFDKFYRVENYKRVAKGSGLGLSLCKHIVETLHHGQIGVESELGMGSKFWVTIPMRYAGSQAAA